ncbi:hypothetical protein, partial [Falsigemmobacter faecalis]|uniref:hypothetical protein n=1 Tax=Falsigemmobacter faecalis TaxID=2488730 RepID=UPI001F31963C
SGKTLNPNRFVQQRPASVFDECASENVDNQNQRVAVVAQICPELWAEGGAMHGLAYRKKKPTLRRAG